MVADIETINRWKTIIAIPVLLRGAIPSSATTPDRIKLLYLWLRFESVRHKIVHDTGTEDSCTSMQG